MLVVYWVGYVLPKKPLLSITEQVLTLCPISKCNFNVKHQKVGHPRTLSALCSWHRPGKAVAPSVVKLLYPDCVRSHVTLFVYAPYGDELPYFHKHYAVLCGVLTRRSGVNTTSSINPYPTAFPYGNGMVLHFYQQQESSTTKTVHKVINKGLKTYV